MKYYAAITIKVCEFEAKDSDQANNRLDFIERMLSQNGILPIQNENWELVAIQENVGLFQPLENTEGESNA